MGGLVPLCIGGSVAKQVQEPAVCVGVSGGARNLLQQRSWFPRLCGSEVGYLWRTYSHTGMFVWGCLDMAVWEVVQACHVLMATGSGAAVGRLLVCTG